MQIALSNSSLFLHFPEAIRLPIRRAELVRVHLLEHPPALFQGSLVIPQSFPEKNPFGNVLPPELARLNSGLDSKSMTEELANQPFWK